MSFRRLESRGDVEEIPLVGTGEDLVSHNASASTDKEEESIFNNGEVSVIKEGDSESEYADQETSLIHEEEEEIDEHGVVREYEIALKFIGFGLFHVILIAINGLALSSDAIEVLSISFVLPIIREEDEFDLADWQNAFLSSIIFLGMLFGGYLWGGLSDLTGRRHTILMSLTVNGVFGFLSAFAPNYWVFVLFRFISGVG